MSAFTEFVDYREACGGRFLLERPLHWEVGRKGSGLVVRVPAGFAFDISAPRCLQWIVSPLDRRYLLAAAVHDWLLQDGWKRNRAAIEFYHGLLAMGVKRWWAVVMTACVLVWTS